MGFILEYYVQSEAPISKMPEQTGTSPGRLHLEKDVPPDVQRSVPTVLKPPKMGNSKENIY